MNFLLQTKEDKLTITGFDLNVGIKSNVTVSIERHGITTVAAKLFFDVVSKVEGELLIESDESYLLIKSLFGEYKLPQMSAEDYPSFPVLGEIKSFYLKSEVLIDGLKSTLFAVSNEESKKILCGVNIHYQDSVLVFAATDGHRLSVAQFSENEIDINVTIPAKSARELERSLTPERNLIVKVERSQFIVTSLTPEGEEDFIFTTRLLEGDYPNYNALIPVDFVHKAIVDRKQIVDSIERVSLFSSTLIRIAFDFEEQSIHIVSEQAQEGFGNEQIKANIFGKSITFYFSIKYLLDGLKSLPVNEVMVTGNKTLSPVVIFPEGMENRKYLLMPIELKK